ncbi:hypothetical protein [Dokdonella sp.]|uniref:hypothetical protein n=1 Tax=Dokdonella sp. TaxID=2291710 RepID=UPI0035282D8C
MASKPDKADKPRASLWRILGAVATIVVVVSYTMIHTNFVTGRSLLLAFPGWEVTYRSCWPNPFGGAWVSDVTLMPYEGDEQDAYHFDSLSVDVPMFQFYSSGLRKKFRNRLEAIKEIRLEFSGGHSNLSWPISDELLLFGNASAAPFEAMGCMDDEIWLSDELTDMGLAAEPTRLTMSWNRSNSRLIKEQSIHTPGVGRVDYREEQIMYDDFPLFSLIETDQNELVSGEWHVRDEGFVVARNAWCARKDEISPAQFLDRHMATVPRVLAAFGMEANAETTAAYRRYAEKGGSLDLVVNYSPTIDAAVYEDDDWGRWLARTRGELLVDGYSTKLGMRAIAERPFGEEFEEMTAFAALQAEQARLAARRAALAEQADPDSDKREPEATPVSMATFHAETLAEAEALFAQAEEAVATDDTIVDYSKLGAEVGQRFVVHAKGKKPMRVEVVGTENGVVQVRRHQRSGWIEHGLARSGFEFAERVR